MGKLFSMSEWLKAKFPADKNEDDIILYFCANKDNETAGENPGTFICADCYKKQTPDRPFYADDFFTRGTMEIQEWLGQEHCDICGKLID
jgi:hypothetical protein